MRYALRWPSFCTYTSVLFRRCHRHTHIGRHRLSDSQRLGTYLQLVLDAPLTIPPLLHVHAPLVWSLAPPTQPLHRLATLLHVWMIGDGFDVAALTEVDLLRHLQRTPTSVLVPLFGLLGTVLRLHHDGSSDSHVADTPDTNTVAQQAATNECKWTRCRGMVSALKTTCLGLRTATKTYTTSSVPVPPMRVVSPTPLASVLDRVCLRTLTCRADPVVLHWAPKANDARRETNRAYEEVRLIRYTPHAVDARGRPAECRIRRLAKTGSSAYKSVSVATLVFPVGTSPPLACTMPKRECVGVDTQTTPVVPPHRSDVPPTLVGLVDLPMWTDAPLQTPHHVGRLYVHMNARLTSVGVYTESRLNDGTTQRLYTFDREAGKVYTRRSWRRTDGIRV